MESNRIRSLFLDFFAGKEHLIMPGFSLVPQNDPTLLLVGAGMAPLKPYFTGERKPPHPRVATCQKCVRTPDIERVGLTGRHATFFEMLGNFSFGDYFKQEAIAWAWELVTEGYRLPSERLWVSIFQDDDEAFRIWSREIGIAEERIIRLGRKDNFWEIGQGPCGPCSEIYYDLGAAVGCGQDSCAVGCDCDRFLEIWNLVFTQYNREASGELTPLRQTNIDTGAGLERLAMALQGVSSLYQTDLVYPIYQLFAGRAVHRTSEQEIALRIITEHSRGIVFLVADGVIPSNEGRGYVLRRLLRRAVRYGCLLGIEKQLLTEAAPLIVSLMNQAYPELKEKESYIKQVINLEENRFRETLNQGLEILEKQIAGLKQAGAGIMAGEQAFKLYDTYGFPLELTREILAERGLRMDLDSFNRALSGQQHRAREARARKGASIGNNYQAAAGLITIFTGYEKEREEAEILLALVDGEPREEIRAEELSGEERLELFLDRTPFYAEAGGQVGDTGLLYGQKGQAVVLNTAFTAHGTILHQVALQQGALRKGERIVAEVDVRRRKAIRRSHTATHLLHHALKELLGGHINQAGSLVAPDRLRFDFTHFSAMETEQLQELEQRLNELIWENLKVTPLQTTLEKARQAGAEALFGEKYDPEAVRMIVVGDYSKELCGGTHVTATGEIGFLRLVGEEGTGAGVRRIEALTGLEAYRLSSAERNLLDSLSAALRTSQDRLEERLNVILEEHRFLEKSNQDLRQRLVLHQVDLLLSQVQPVAGIDLLSAAVEAESADNLRIYIDELKKKLASAVIVLGSVKNGKVLLAGAVTADLVKKGLHAGKIINAVAGQVGGSGGGRPDMAQAGGKNPAALQEALLSVKPMLQGMQKLL